MNERYNRGKSAQDAQSNQADALNRIADALTALVQKYAAEFLPMPKANEPPAEEPVEPARSETEVADGTT